MSLGTRRFLLLDVSSGFYLAIPVDVGIVACFSKCSFKRGLVSFVLLPFMGKIRGGVLRGSQGCMQTKYKFYFAPLGTT